jgi:abortive infection bacteriophage resistance protein
VITYKKKPLTYTEQVQLLKSRGLQIEDVTRAERYLGEISYYRLSAYYIPFCKTKDRFTEGVSFEQILDLYLFDRELRLIIFNAIERIEVAFRAQIIYQLAHKYNDSHWQDNAALFSLPWTNPRTGKTTHIYQETQYIIKYHKSTKYPEVFVKHYISKYNEPSNPPSWMSIELLTIGELSRLYQALINNSDKQVIANFFKLHYTVFESWLHTLVYSRNICAHHCRIWNREFAIKPDVLKKPKLAWIDPVFNTNNHRSFYFLSILKYLLISANPGNHLKNRLNELFDKHPKVPIAYMGIPTIDGKLIDWNQQPLWK